MPASPIRPFAGALFGAAITVIALTGAVAIADTPRQLSDAVQAIASTEVFEIAPASFEDEPQFQAQIPASGVYDEPALQVTYDVYA